MLARGNVRAFAGAAQGFLGAFVDIATRREAMPRIFGASGVALGGVGSDGTCSRAWDIAFPFAMLAAPCFAGAFDQLVFADSDVFHLGGDDALSSVVHLCHAASR